MAAAGFPGYMFGFPQGAGVTAASMMGGAAAWFPAAGMAGIGGASAASFHAPGKENEIKLFVGGLQF